MEVIRDYEASLGRLLVFADCGADLYGIRNSEHVCHRVPTFCFDLRKAAPQDVVEALAHAGISARDGHMYSPRLMRRLELKPEIGTVRVSLVHYNTFEEIERFWDVLLKFVAGE